MDSHLTTLSESLHVFQKSLCSYALDKSSLSIGTHGGHFGLFVCLFWIRTRICPAGSTPEGGPTEKLPYHPGHSSPPGLVVLHVSYPPILIVMHPASGQSPPLSYTDILPSIWSAPSLSSCPTHVNNPHTYEPLKPTYKLCYLLISTALS